jgi:hypothetical protein
VVETDVHARIISAMRTPPLVRALAATLLLAAVHAEADPAVAPKMRSAAEALIASVETGKRGKLVLPFASGQRVDWHYTPRSRPGLSFADLNAAQRDSVHKLLRTGLSAVGHRKVVNIVELELVLREIETFGLLRDPEKYSLVVFGDPHAANPWGWRFEGHHLSLNFTLRGDKALATTPSFLGANPAEVPKGPKRGLRVLAEEEDEGRKLLALLDAKQRASAIIDTRTYGDIVTRAADRVSPLEGKGLEARAMTDGQKAQLRKLVEVYAANFEAPLAAARMARAAEGFDAIRFAWAGATDKGRPHYYRVQGPKFLIEYDASQNDGNHIHTVWRDFDGDFGWDLLREHHAATRGTAHKH